MTARYSSPSAGVGVNRFRVWPNKTTDSWNTTEMAGNFDLLDSLIGVPSAGTPWPAVTGVDGGIYREVKLLQNDRTPIGTVIAWWRPSGSIPIPTGWVEVVGQTLTGAQHDFAGGGSITLPDLRNRFILGADSTKAALSVAGIPGSGTIDNASGAPGLGFVGGSNQVVLAIANMPPHDHGGGAHGHAVTDAGHTHPVNDGGHNHGGVTGSTGFDSNGVATNGRGIGNNGGGFEFGVHNHSIPLGVTGISLQSATTGISIQSSGTIVNSQGNAAPYENRPAYVGLIFLMRVKYSTVP